MRKPPVKWGLRVNGIREGGDPYRTWHDAKEALWKRIDNLHYGAQRACNPYADEIGKAKAVLLADMRRAEHETPRANLRITIPWVSYPGKTITYEITREPF